MPCIRARRNQQQLKTEANTHGASAGDNQDRVLVKRYPQDFEIARNTNNEYVVAPSGTYDSQNFYLLHLVFLLLLVVPVAGDAITLALYLGGEKKKQSESHGKYFKKSSQGQGGTTRRVNNPCGSTYPRRDQAPNSTIPYCTAYW